MKQRQKSRVTDLNEFQKADGRNPVPSRGYRNFFCTHYNQCLDFAILNAWETWACKKCAYKKQVQVYDDFPATNRDTALYHELPGELHKLAG